ncbi:hypothetical protein AC519_3313 [Pseudomonas savastanoi]|nr:hypothetical protein AC519_3313 [Pseudomonas savastanoi]
MLNAFGVAVALPEAMQRLHAKKDVRSRTRQHPDSEKHGGFDD